MIHLRVIQLVASVVLMLPAQTEDISKRVEGWIRRAARERVDGGNARASANSLEHALRLARQAGDPRLISRCLVHLSEAYIHVGAFEKAASAAAEALDAARRAGDRRLEGAALSRTGNALFYREEFPKALARFQAALAIARELGDSVGEAQALQDIGIVHRNLGQPEEALEFLHQALSLFRRTGSKPPICSALQNLGKTYANLGAHRLAAQAYEEAWELYAGGNPETSYNTLLRTGQLYLESGQPARALELFQQAQAWLGNRTLPGRGMVDDGLGSALEELGRIGEAIEVRRRALAVSDPTFMAKHLQALGRLHLDRDGSLAAQYFQRAATAWMECKHMLNWKGHAALAEAYRRQGDFERAIRSYESAIDLLESLRGQLASPQNRAAFLGKNDGIYEQFVEVLMERHEDGPGRGDDLRAFAMLERGKARAVLDGIVEARLGARRSLDEDLRQREDELSRRLAALRLGSQDRRQILERIEATEQELERLVAVIRRRNPRYAATWYPQPLTPEQARGILEKESAVLAYEMTSEHVFGFVVTANSFHAERLPCSLEPVARRVQNYVELIAQGDEAGTKAIGRRIYLDLVAPLRNHISPRIRRLILIPDGVLHYLPFEALPQGDLDRYLVEDFAISYSPSLTVLAQLRNPRGGLDSPGRADLLVFASPEFRNVLEARAGTPAASAMTRFLHEAENWPIAPLGFAAQEARAIMQYAGAGSAVYTGTQASEGRLKTLPLDRFRVVHFSTHAVVSESQPSRSALVLAAGPQEKEDGFLQAREIYRLVLPSELVVLAACQTARGPILSGEGVQGLAQAFFYAGAHSVIASLWNINDERTSRFMAALYRHLSEGLSKSDALRAAKLDLLGNSSTRAPRFWAPFVLIGEADRAVALGGAPVWERHGRWSLVGATLVAAARIAFVVLRRRSRPSAAGVQLLSQYGLDRAPRERND